MSSPVSPSDSVDATPSPTPAPSVARPRLDSVDLLRGMIMVLMALDHVRDFFPVGNFDPLDLSKTTPALFLTRWITHFCAPVFTFLAGTGAYLALTRGKSKGALSWFLFSRGLWLAFLEVTWVRCIGWNFDVDFHFIGVGTLWSIGWSMVVLSALVFLPTWAITAFGVAMIAVHNAFDWVKPEVFGSLGWLWKVLHANGWFEWAPGFRFGIGYALIPWIGVVAAGYGFGAIFLLEPERRRKVLLGLGVFVTLTFVALRWTNTYGDFKSGEWETQKNFLFTIFSFVHLQKYPPSLLYLLMTLGPAFIVLAFLDRGTPRVLQPILVFGRVPLFYYLLHLPLIHGLAVLAAYARFGHADWLIGSPFNWEIAPPGCSFSLPVIYLIWIGVVLLLYPVCRWFAGVKRRRRDAWLSYL